MTVVDVLALVFGVVGVAYGIRCYYELWKWAKECQNARVAVAYNRRVQMQPTLVDLLIWARQVNKGERGRVIYKNQKVSVAIVRPVIPPGKVRKAIRLGRTRGNAPPPPTIGSWTAQDQTPGREHTVTHVTGNTGKEAS